MTPPTTIRNAGGWLVGGWVVGGWVVGEWMRFSRIHYYRFSLEMAPKQPQPYITRTYVFPNKLIKLGAFILNLVWNTPSFDEIRNLT